MKMVENDEATKTMFLTNGTVVEEIKVSKVSPSFMRDGMELILGNGDHRIAKAGTLHDNIVDAEFQVVNDFILGGNR